MKTMTDKRQTKSRSKSSFTTFMSGLVARLHQNGQYKTWQHYRAAYRSLMRFRQDRDFPLSRMDGAMMEAYEAHLKQRGVCRNTSSFYMRILRAVYNRAVEQGLVVQQHPFRHVYTGIDKTRKRAIPLDAVRRISRLTLSGSPSAELARDAFMLSFYLRGISFVDLAHLKKTDLRDGYLHYTRSKTRRQVTVRWEPPMQALLDKYKPLTARSPYLFPFLLPDGDGQKPLDLLYHNAECRMAYHLKNIQRQAGIQSNLTLYVARHSWASAARDRQQPVSVISEALGHDSEVTTQIYLRSIQTSEVDKLNADLLSDLS